MAKRKGKKYEAIIDAAVQVIAKFGYHQSQVAKIARAANVADGTIYLYFENKEDILISLFREKLGTFVKKAVQELQQIDSPTEQLYRLIQLHFLHLEQDPELAIVTQLELRQPGPELRQAISRILRNYLQLIDQLIENGMKEGLFRPDLDVRITRKMIFGTIDETVTSWVMDQQKYSLSAMVEPIHRLFVEGMQLTKQGGTANEHRGLLETDV